MSERYLRESDVKAMLTSNEAMKKYFPWAEKMFLDLVDELPEADVVPVDWIEKYGWNHTGELANVTCMLEEYKNGDKMELSD